MRTPAADPRSDGRHSGHSGRQAGARMKVVPSLGSVLPAPAARSTPATAADPDHLQLPPAVLDHVRSPILFSWMTLPSSPALRTPAADPRSDRRHSGHRGRQAVARMKVVPSLGSVLPAPAARSTSPILITCSCRRPCWIPLRNLCVKSVPPQSKICVKSVPPMRKKCTPSKLAHLYNKNIYKILQISQPPERE